MFHGFFSPPAHSPRSLSVSHSLSLAFHGSRVALCIPQGHLQARRDLGSHASASTLGCVSARAHNDSCARISLSTLSAPDSRAGAPRTQLSSAHASRGLRGALRPSLRHSPTVSAGSDARRPADDHDCNLLTSCRSRLSSNLPLPVAISFEHRWHGGVQETFHSAGGHVKGSSSERSSSLESGAGWAFTATHSLAPPLKGLARGQVRCEVRRAPQEQLPAHGLASLRLHHDGRCLATIGRRWHVVARVGSGTAAQ
jgi:hypothetical protein